MRYLILFNIIIALSSCEAETASNYEKLVNRADKIIIIKWQSNDSIILTTEPVLEHFKNILKRNIKPESQRKFIADNSIELYAEEKKIAALLISNGEKPYVNFRSDSLNFTFQLTYGIGMFLSEFPVEHRR